MKKQSMLFVCGPLCSGKSTWCKKEAERRGWQLLEVSSIVKQLLLQAKTREDLLGHGELDFSIIEEMKKQLNQPTVVSGARQLSILKAFQGEETEYVWLDVSSGERYYRYVRRNREGDDLSKEAFNKADQAENKLGLVDIMYFIRQNGKTIQNS